MASYAGIIQANCQRVVTDLLAVAVQYCTLTSAPGVEPRTWSGWTPTTGVLSAQTIAQEFDEARGEWVRRYRASIRTSDAVALKQGDQVQLADGTIWAVDAKLSGAIGYGSFKYGLVRDIGTLATGGDRKAGQ